jgi:hypothetical protein
MAMNIAWRKIMKTLDLKQIISDAHNIYTQQPSTFLWTACATCVDDIVMISTHKKY